MKKFALHTMLALATTFAFTAFAQGQPAAGADAAKTDAPAAETEKAVDVKVTGENYCLLGAYGGDAAKPAANAENFKNGLKVTEVKGADDKALEGYEGKTLHYLPTEAAAPLIAGEENVGKTVTVTGKLYPNAGVLVVESFEAAEGGDEWEALPTGTLSGQQVL